MKILRWCGKHKIWTFWIVAMMWLPTASYFFPTSLATGSGGYETGSFLARAFCVYLIAIWGYAGIKKLIRVINSE